MKKYFAKINCISICKLMLTLCRISLSCFNGGFREQRRLLCAELHAALNSLSTHQRNLHCVKLLFPCLQRSFQSSTIFTRRINALPRQSTILRITSLCCWTARFFLHGICCRRKSVYRRRCSIKLARKSAAFAASLHTEFFSAAAHRRAVAVYQT